MNSQFDIKELDIMFQKYFDADGSFKLRLEEYFNGSDDNEYVKYEVIEAIKHKLERLPAYSPAVALYYADEFAGQTRGNYSAYMLYRRWRT